MEQTIQQYHHAVTFFRDCTNLHPNIIDGLLKTETPEIWAPIRWRFDGPETEYQVSTHGRVASYRNGSRRVLKTFRTRIGYLIAQLMRNDERWQPTVHSLVMAAFRGDRPVGENGRNFTIDHLDFDKHNCHLWNLEYVSLSENLQRAIQKGLRGDSSRRGEANHGVRLNEGVVRIIRATPEVAAKTWAETLGVRPATIYKIRNRTLWRHV